MVQTAVGVLLPLAKTANHGQPITDLNKVPSIAFAINVMAHAAQSKHFTTHAEQSPRHQAALGVGHGTIQLKSQKAKQWPFAWIMAEIVHPEHGHAQSR